MATGTARLHLGLHQVTVLDCTPAPAFYWIWTGTGLYWLVSDRGPRVQPLASSCFWTYLRSARKANRGEAKTWMRGKCIC